MPADVSIHGVDELSKSEGAPILRIKELGLEAAEEALACGIVLRTRLRDTERMIPAAFTRSSQPGQR